jgi:hypothetical protein
MDYTVTSSSKRLGRCGSDAPGAHRLSPRIEVLAGRQAGGVGLGLERWDGGALGRGHGRCTSDDLGSEDVYAFSFSVDGLHFQRDRDSFHSHIGNVLSQSDHSSKLLVRDEWIARRNVNLLWLPHEHRAFATAVFGDVIVIGHQSGCISMFEFSF